MQARLLLGPAGSGKTFRCLAEIREALSGEPEGPPLVLVAPKQTTWQLERQLLADSSLEGYTRLQILSFERLAYFVFARLGDYGACAVQFTFRLSGLLAGLALLDAALRKSVCAECEQQGPGDRPRQSPRELFDD